MSDPFRSNEHFWYSGCTYPRWIPWKLIFDTVIKIEDGEIGINARIAQPVYEIWFSSEERSRRFSYSDHDSLLYNVNRLFDEMHRFHGNDITTEITKLQKKIDELCRRLETKVDMMWDAPGMPGWEMTKNHFQTCCEESEKSTDES